MHICFFFFFRYRKICYCNFVNERNITYANFQYDRSSPDKGAFNYILWSMKNEEERVWNSSGLPQEYLKKGGTDSKVSRLIERIEKQMKDEVYCFKAAGMTALIMHKQESIFDV